MREFQYPPFYIVRREGDRGRSACKLDTRGLIVQNTPPLPIKQNQIEILLGSKF
jgi:hypothetical protein